MKKKILVLIPTAVLALSFVIGAGTYALFTGSLTKTDNTMTAGTVILEANRDQGDPVPGPIFYPDSLDPLATHPYDVNDLNPSGESKGGWAPGDSVSRMMILNNSGSLAAKLVGIRAVVQSSYTQTTKDSRLGTVERTVTGITASSDPSAYNEYINNMNIEVKYGNILVYNGLLKDLITGDPAKYVNVLNANDLRIAPDKSGPLNLTCKATLYNTTGNIIQGKNIIFNIDFYAEQYDNNH
jgi:hypothetical protein